MCMCAFDIGMCEVCLCVCVWAQLSLHVCGPVNLCACGCLCTCMWMHACVYMSVCICMFLCVCLCVRACVHEGACMLVCVHVCICYGVRGVFYHSAESIRWLSTAVTLVSHTTTPLMKTCGNTVEWNHSHLALPLSLSPSPSPPPSLYQVVHIVFVYARGEAGPD